MSSRGDKRIPRDYNGGDVVWEETKQTLLHMIKYGINNVRGAEYCELRPYDKSDANRIAYAAMHHLERTDKEAILRGLHQGITPTSSSLKGGPRDSSTLDSRGGNKRYKTDDTSSAQNFCIRCKVEVPEGKYLCTRHYSEWAKYKSAEFPEHFCNTCGLKQVNISYKRPKCRKCYDSSK
jgi:hypothetical protein